MEVDYDDLFADEYLEQNQFTNENTFLKSNVSYYENAKETRRLSRTPIRINVSNANTSSVIVEALKYDKMISNKDSSRDFMKNPDPLCYLFRDALQSYNVTKKLFDLMDSFVQNCENRVQSMQNVHTALDVSWIESERSIWRLIYAVFRHTIDPPDVDLKFDTISETKIIDTLFQKDAAITKYQLIIDWLEENASKDNTPNLLHCQDKSIGWENTLYQLQHTNIPYASTRPLVDEMDPDAPLRQNKHIHDLDKEDENKLLNQMFMEIRRGRVSDAVNMCRLYGQIWRASILQGYMLYNDPNYDYSSNEKLLVVGNPNRDIWKLCAWKLSQSESSPLWKGIVAVFCGNLSAILPFCKTWEDILWAHAKVSVDVRVEQELRTLNGIKSYVDLPDEYWNYKLTLYEIFWELENSTDTSIRMEASKPERTVQKCVILNEIPELVTFLSELCRKNSSDCNFLRFSAHVVICVRLIGFGHNGDEADFVLRTYVEFLMRYKDPEIVAYYTSFLQQEEQITMYAKYLEGIEEVDLRIRCLECAESYNFNIERITELLVETAREKFASESEKTDDDSVSKLNEEDKKKISALDWIMYYDQQRGEAIWQTNALIRQFLMNNKLEAAHLAFEKIPDDSVQLIMELYRFEDEETSTVDLSAVPPKIKAAIKEYLCYKAYLMAEQGFADWFRYFHHEKPIKPVNPGENIQYTEKIVYEHNLSHYESQLQEWKTSVAKQTTMLQYRLYNVLLFPEDGWLVDKFAEDIVRLQELDILRRQCIPKIVLLLYDIFNSSENHEECIKLGDVIVSEDHQLYKVYTKQDLRILFKKLCESSICLLNKNRDPWGHPDIHISKY